MTQLVKVAGDSHPTSVAGAIAGIMREDGKVEVRVMGASAVNQGLKAIIHAIEYLKQDNIVLSIDPMFKNIMVDGNERTTIAIKLSAI